MTSTALSRRWSHVRRLFGGVVVVLVVSSVVAPATSASSLEDKACKRLGRERTTALGTFRCERVRGSLRWKLAKPITGVKVIDGLPFARTLPTGLTAREVAFQFAKDWTALMACLDWGPDNHNQTAKNELGPITSKCNKAVWGTPNAFMDWYVRGRLTDEAYYAPVSVLWEKYTSYGATLRHRECPDGGGWDLVCTGFPRGHWNWYEGHVFTHHIFYTTMRVTYGAETWRVDKLSGPKTVEDVRRKTSPTGSEFDPMWAAWFAYTPLEASYWEYPGCRLIGRDANWERLTYLQDCTVYWAYRDLSGNP